MSKRMEAVFEALGRYGVQCSETKELAPPQYLLDAIELLAQPQGLTTEEREALERVERWLGDDETAIWTDDHLRAICAALRRHTGEGT